MAARDSQTSGTRGIVFGMPLDLLSMDGTVAACVRLVEARRPAHHVVLNAGKVVLASRDGRLRDIVRSADVVSADGQSVVWAGRILGLCVPERVPGIDLMHRLLAESAARGWPVYFLGARPEVLRAAITRLETQYPGLVVAGSHHGYFEHAEDVVANIRDAAPRVLFVAFSSPAKEYFVADHAGELGDLLTVGVGGSLDIVAGITRRAPVWMQRVGLEWLYRLAQEPRRMWRRYLCGNATFLLLTARELLRARRSWR